MARRRTLVLIAAPIAALGVASCFGPLPIFGRAGDCAFGTEQHDGCWPHDHAVAANVGAYCRIDVAHVRCQMDSVDHTARAVTAWSSIAVGAEPWTMPNVPTGFRVFAISATGQLFVTGESIEGRLGLGELTSAPDLTPVAAGTPYRSVCSGSNTSCAVTREGELQCWGNGTMGGWPAGVHGIVDTPTRVGTLDDWASVSCWDRFTCGIREAGQVHCWGAYSPLGPGTPSETPNIADVVPMPPATYVSVGREHACAITLDGTYCWGTAKFVGVGRSGSDTDVLLPQRLDVPPLTRLTAGLSWTCGLTADGTDALWCWGDNQSAQTGLTAPPFLSIPTLVPRTSLALDLAAGTFFTCFRSSSHDVTCEGVPPG